MTSKSFPIPIRSAPGIQRDGTRLAAQAYADGVWCRFQRGLPRKMGGYISLTDTLPEKVYGLASYSQGGTLYQHLGSASFLTQVLANNTGNFTGLNDRTPAGFSPSVDTLWQFDVLADPAGGNARLIAHPGLNLADIANDVETDIYAGDITASGALTVTAMDPVSGGILVLYPYLLAFSNAGRVDISNLEDLSVPPPNSAFVTGSKIIRGLSLRGGGGGPAGLLWSLDSLIRATFNDPAGDPFAFDTIADDISVMSSRGIIADQGIYYWAGVDKFYMFNGVVRELPNSMNVNFFLQNINFSQRQKVFAYKVPRFSEIWWCFPFGSATECNWAVIYNYKENCWYDTPLPEGGRSDGIYPKVYPKPFLVGTETNSSNELTLWQHETGTDAINGSSVQPIRSYFETGNITLLTSEKPSAKSLYVERTEPDFVQVGNLSLTVVGEANSRASTIDATTKTFPPGPTTAEFQLVNLKDAVRRILRFRFESNTAGGDYEMGAVFAHVGENDERLTQ